MQPNQSTPPPPAESPYDFILKDPAKTKGPGFAGNKIVLLIIGLVILIFAIIILSSIFNKKGVSNSTKIIDLMAQEQEIIRVSTEAQQSLKDPNNMALSSTVIISLTSQNAQYLSYMGKINVKVSAAQLASKTNKNTDTNLQNAVLSNSYDSAYDSYLKQALTDYQNAMSDLANTSSQNFLQILRPAYASNKTLLQSPEIARLSSG